MGTRSRISGRQKALKVNESTRESPQAWRENSKHPKDHLSVYMYVYVRTSTDCCNLKGKVEWKDQELQQLSDFVDDAFIKGFLKTFSKKNSSL